MTPQEHDPVPGDDRLEPVAPGEDDFDDDLDGDELDEDDLEDDLDEDDLDELDEDDLDEDELVHEALVALTVHGPMEPSDLVRRIGMEPDDLDLVAQDPLVVVLADERLAAVASLFARTVFTHRLTEREVRDQVLVLDTDFAVLERFLCEGDHWHLQGGASASLVDDVAGAGSATPGGPPHATSGEAPEATPGPPEATSFAPGPGSASGVDEALRAEGFVPEVLSGPEGWLGAATAGDLIGLRVVGSDDAEAVVEVAIDPAVAEVTVPEAMSHQLHTSFSSFGDGDSVPVNVAELLCQVAADAPVLVEGPVAPLSEVLPASGFEVRFGHAGLAGTDWDAFLRLHEVVGVAAENQLEPDEAHRLVMVCELCRLHRLGKLDRLDREIAREVAGLLAEPGVAKAFAQATATWGEATMEFLAQTRGAAGFVHHAGVAWAEALLAGWAGDTERAESCLAAALDADPGYEPAVEDAAWYASARGDAAGAIRLLQRVEDAEEGRLAMLQRYSTPLPSRLVGRNEPCPCGSGRKYKHCCLARDERPAAAPLPERVRWIWEKLCWWLEREAHGRRLFDVALVLNGGPPRRHDAVFAARLDQASSLVLFADGEVHRFLATRGAILPDDERNLVEQWALREPSVHEVVAVRPGEGADLRDLRTGETVAVVERSGSRDLQAGDLIFAHVVFDGVGYQLVGGIVDVPLRIRQLLLDLLDQQPTAMDIAELFEPRPPQMLTREGEPTVFCQAVYQLDDTDAAAAGLDAVLERQGAGWWSQWVEIDGQRWQRGEVRLDGDRLEVSATSEARMERLEQLVSEAVPGAQLVDQHRMSPAEAIEAGRRSAPATSRAGHGRRESSPVPPEAASALADIVRQHEQRWVDEPVPALAGLTPRQAAADPTRREDLVALLHEFDRTPLPEGAVSFDTGRLRHLLGLVEP